MVKKGQQLVIVAFLYRSTTNNIKMKKTLLILSCLTLAMASCGGDSSKTNEDSSAATETTAPGASDTPMLPGEKLIATSDCIGCHNKTQKVVGPAYVEVAKKYELNDKNVDYLADKIISGGQGVWGEVPMTPHPTIAPDDAKEMARYILSLKE